MNPNTIVILEDIIALFYSAEMQKLIADAANANGSPVPQAAPPAAPQAVSVGNRPQSVQNAVLQKPVAEMTRTEALAHQAALRAGG